MENKKFIKSYTDFNSFKNDNLEFVQFYNIDNFTDIIDAINDSKVDSVDMKVETIYKNKNYYYLDDEESEEIDTVYVYDISKELEYYKQQKLNKLEIYENKWRELIFNSTKEEIFNKLKSIKFPF